MTLAYPGDEVFFHHKGRPKVGKVLCVGQHGCTVDHEGEQHRLKWEHIAGHKKRVQQQYKVMHEGEDGLIVQNQHGHQRLLSIPPEARADQLQLDKPAKPGKTLAKSMLPAVAQPQHVRVIERLAPEVSVQGMADVAQSIADAIQHAAVVLSAGQSVATDGMAAQLNKMAEMQAQMIEAIKALTQTPPIINVEPKIEVAAPTMPAPVVNVTVPEQPAPIVQVTVPEQAAPVVNVTLPEQPSPVVHIEPVVVPAPVVHVDAPVVNVEPVVVPAPAITVNVPEQPAPQIVVEMPEPKRIVTEIQRDKEGNITGAVQKEV